MNLRIALVIPALLLFGSCAVAPRDVTDPGSTPVSYNLQVTIVDGKLADFRALMTEMVASTKEEPGTLVYEWFLAADGRSCQINEHFADTAAYAAHSENFGSKFAARFMPCVSINKVTVYGNADAKAREMLAGLNPVYVEAIGGFRR